MDIGELATHGGSSAVSVAVGWGFSRFMAWRKEERAEDDAKAEREKAEKRREDEDAAFGKLRDRLLKLETRTDHFEQLVASLVAELKEMRAELKDEFKEIREEIRKDLADHRRIESEQRRGQ